MPACSNRKLHLSGCSDILSSGSVGEKKDNKTISQNEFPLLVQEVLELAHFKSIQSTLAPRAMTLRPCYWPKAPKAAGTGVMGFLDIHDRFTTGSFFWDDPDSMPTGPNALHSLNKCSLVGRAVVDIHARLAAEVATDLKETHLAA